MRTARDQLLLALSEAAYIDDGDVAQSARAITAAALEGLGIDRCGVWMRAGDGQSMRCLHLCDFADGGHRDDLDLELTAAQYPRYFQALDRERAIVADIARTHPDTAEFAHGYLDVLGIQSMLDCPIRQHGRMVGIVCAEHRGAARDWTDDEVGFLGSLSDLFGRVLTAAERRDYQQRLEALNASLEERVAERTAELRAALDYLEKARSHLVEREKMAALGQLVAGVAHEINTPVGVIVTAVSHCAGLLAALREAQAGGTLTRTRFETSLAEIADGLEMAQRNAVRAAGLVESFKRGGRPDPRRAQPLRAGQDLGRRAHDPLADAAPARRPGAFGRRARRGVRQLCRQPRAGRHQPRRERLCARLWRRPAGRRPHRPRGRAGGRDGLAARHRRGRGHAPEVLQKAFEPFYTTARMRGGTGLGLSIVRTLVERTPGGEIRIETAAGAGCRVDVRFPCQAPA